MSFRKGGEKWESRKGRERANFVKVEGNGKPVEYPITFENPEVLMKRRKK
jgi:hypothetical protein